VTSTVPPAIASSPRRLTPYAFGIGRGREVTDRAFRDAFARGGDLSIKAHVLDSARQAGLDRGEAEAAMGDPEIKRVLREATEAAHTRGVFGVPTVAVGDELFWGDDRLEAAASAVSVGPAA
jgi:2-hydroxychromene-2-carboxylate isomerase